MSSPPSGRVNPPFTPLTQVQNLPQVRMTTPPTPRSNIVVPPRTDPITFPPRVPPPSMPSASFPSRVNIQPSHFGNGASPSAAPPSSFSTAPPITSFSTAPPITSSVVQPPITSSVVAPPSSPVGLSRISQGEMAPSQPAFSLIEGTKAETYQELVAKAGITQELLNAGYVPIEKIIVQGPTGRMYAQYIRVADMFGEQFLVDLGEKQGYVEVTSEDMIVKMGEKVSSVPYSVKMGLKECMGLGVCGIGFNCGKEFCVTITDPLSGEGVETVFVEACDKQGNCIALIERVGATVAMPIFRFEDVVHSPEGVVSKIVKEANKVIRKIMGDECRKAYNICHKKLDQLHDNHVLLVEFVEGMESKLEKQIDFLERSLVKATDPKVRQEIQLNLRRRKEMRIALYLPCDPSDRCRYFDEVNAILTAITNFYSMVFKDVDKVLTE